MPYFDGLTLLDCRKLYGDSIGLTIIFIRAIGCRNMAGEGPPWAAPWGDRKLYYHPYIYIYKNEYIHMCNVLRVCFNLDLQF